MDDPKKTCRLIRLLVENFKRLKVADVTPGRHAVIVSGKNKAGKSSFLDAIDALFGGKKACPTRPIREGADECTIMGVIGDRKAEFLVKRVFTPDGKTAVEITSGEGYKAPTPQAILDDMRSAFAFDPAKFPKMSAREQMEVLRELVGLDFIGMDAERAAIYSKRADENREIKRARAQADGIVVPEGTPEEAVSIVELMGEQQRALDQNAGNARERGRLDGMKVDVSNAASHITSLEDSIMELQSKLEDAKANLLQIESARDAQAETAQCLEDADVAEVQARIVTAESTNQAVSLRTQRAKLAQELLAHEEAADALSDQIDALDAEKRKLLGEANWPVEGLSLGDKGVLYEGLPFSQASGAEQLAVSFAMAAASNPMLSVATIRDASLLDDEQMDVVRDLAAKYDFQLFLEVVGDEAGPCGILIEEGVVTEGGTVTRSEQPASDEEAEWAAGEATDAEAAADDVTVEEYEEMLDEAATDATIKAVSDAKASGLIADDGQGELNERMDPDELPIFNSFQE